jgi:hypothetical protein
VAVLMRIASGVALAVLLLPVPVHAHMGPELPFLHPAGKEGALAAAVVASYLSRQMGREVTMREAPSAVDALAGVVNHEGPLALVPLADWEELKGRNDALTAVGPPFPGPRGRYQLVVGREAAKQLSFSLLPQYASRLAEACAGWDWEKALSLAADGGGRRKVALDLLRASDLI